MVKYLLKRILYGMLSIVAVVAVVMIMVYSLMNRDLIFANDASYSHRNNNARIVYKYQQWEKYGYLDYVAYSDYLLDLTNNGVIDEETRSHVVGIGRTADKDSEDVGKYVKQFTEYYESKGYTVVRLDAVMMNARKVADGGQQQLFAYKDIPLIKRIASYFSHLISIDNIHSVKDDVGERGLTFTLHDPVYGGEKFSPAIMGNGTQHKYLLYFDSQFPYIHQNMATINLGTSYSVNAGIDVFTTLTQSQGAYVKSTITYPTGLTENSAEDLHSATYMKDSRSSNVVYGTRYTDDYTNVDTIRSGKSKVGYSFTIGIIAAISSYLIGIPLGVLMARKKDKLVDKIGTAYIIFIVAVPSLAYVFMIKAIGSKMGIPTTFNMDAENKMMYILPIVSLALPSIAGLMKWLRRYMIDQMNSDYVKFARSEGLTEGEIFSKHILKNAAIPIIHDIPGGILGALAGAIVTERVFAVPGAGSMLTQAINKYDNGVIVGMTLFYAVLTVVSFILGDILMSLVDPRISYSTKGR
ncbi:MAG: ABC transporter permease [Butyrivibrio sp.]